MNVRRKGPYGKGFCVCSFSFAFVLTKRPLSITVLKREDGILERSAKEYFEQDAPLCPRLHSYTRLHFACSLAWLEPLLEKCLSEVFVLCIIIFFLLTHSPTYL